MSEQPAAAPPPRPTRVEARQERARLRRARRRRFLIGGVALVVVAAVAVTLILVFAGRNTGGPVADTSPDSSAASPPSSAPPGSSPATGSSTPAGSATAPSTTPSTGTSPTGSTAAPSVGSSTLLRPTSTGLLTGWSIASTSTGQDAAAQSFLCQTQRYLDPAGTDTWVRRLTGPGGGQSVVQYTDAAASTVTAQRSYATVSSWLAGCLDSRVQLLGAATAAGVGEQGVVSSFSEPASATTTRLHTLALVRTGRAVVVLDRARLVAPAGVAAAVASDRTATASLAKTAVAMACGAAGGRCPGAANPTLTPTLLPSTRAGFLNPVELPVVGSSAQPWVGTPSTSLSASIGSGCDQIDPKKPATSTAVTRDYLIPDPASPATLGFTTDVLTYPAAGTATALLGQVRTSVGACTKRIQSAKVSTTGAVTGGGIGGKVTGTAWRMTYDIGSGKTATYRIGVAVDGTRLVHVSYLVSPGYDVSDAQFTSVLVPAAERAALG